MSLKSSFFSVLSLAVFQCQLASAADTPQRAQQSGALEIAVVQTVYGKWNAMDTASGPNPSEPGWGITVLLKNTSDKPASATIDPVDLQIEDVAGKTCAASCSYAAEKIAYATLVRLGNVHFTNTWGWKDKAAIVRTFDSGDSTVLRLVYLNEGTLLEFLDGKTVVGTLMTSSKWELTLPPQKSMTLVFVFNAPAANRPASLKWPGASPIDLQGTIRER